MANERRSSNRRKFGYYMPVIDNNTREVIGYLSDISVRGFKLESQKNIIAHSTYHLRLNLTPDFSTKSYIEFIAEAVWSQVDPIVQYEYNHGFQIVSITAEDQVIFQRIFEKYGVA